MFWIGLYPVIAVVAAVAIFLIAQWLREPGAAAPNGSGRCAALAGLLWPVLVLGVAQWGVIATIQLGLAAADPVDDGSSGLTQESTS